DDFFTPAFDVSSMGGSTANLNFMYTGAFRTGISFYMTDTLEIDYSINGGTSWNLLKYLDKANIGAVGSKMTPFTPTSMSDWKLQSITLPPAARTPSTFFRFRYRPGAPDIYGYGSSNYFYIDRLNVNNQPLGVNTIMSDDRGITVSPNPTSGSSYITIKEPINTVAHIVVTDVAGKTVYTTQQQVSNGATRVEIPASYISVKGMYLVQVTTDDQTQTEKLIVY
ncbi:MAG: T9SS type A sorting domain-containing protein, partial [Bacteroidetes bacterium]|nr:T9SS type A sorting domain-containing protein [Bacteroidota bacterium]